MIERIKFWWNLKRDFPFIYVKRTGEGYTPLSYNIITDEVMVRESRLGYVCGDYDGEPCSRDFFVTWYENNLKWWANND